MMPTVQDQRLAEWQKEAEKVAAMFENFAWPNRLGFSDAVKEALTKPTTDDEARAKQTSGDPISAHWFNEARRERQAKEKLASENERLKVTVAELERRLLNKPV